MGSRCFTTRRLPFLSPKSSMASGRVDPEATLQSQSSIDDFTQPLSVTGLFSDATGYREAIHGGLSPEFRSVNPALRSVQDFAELTGGDLEPPEHEVVGRFAQLAAEEWSSQEGEDLLTEEPEVMSDEEHEEGSEGEVDVDQTPRPPPTVPAIQTDLEEADTRVSLTSDEVLALLIEEFGPLSPAGEEKLLLEADGAVIQDVVILVRGSPLLRNMTS